MNTNDEKQTWYAAFKAHDPRFDGRVYICVASTGIYCRPVCRVRTPRADNCAFAPSAAAAEAAGFRPCRKCRPELAPGFAPVDASAGLAWRTARALDNGGVDESDLADLAAGFGVSDRHLRRVFGREFGVPPVQYAQTRRLLLAKSLLTDTALPITDVAFAAGFGSLRRFNDLFRKRYRMPPSALRRGKKRPSPDSRDGFTLLLGYRPPYDWDGLLAFLAGRAIPGVESVDGGVYRRTVASPLPGWLAVANEAGKNALAVTLSPSLLPTLGGVLARVRHLFDLDCDPWAIYESLSGMNELKPGLCKPGVRLPGCFDGFEMAVRAILGQQITVKAARTLATRMAHTFGAAVNTPFAELTRTFPTPEIVCGLSGTAESRFGPLGVIGARARSILALAEALLRGDVALSPGADPERQIKNLLALPGFGPWTAQYLAMRALSWPDAFPHTDYGVKKALADRPPGEILRLAETWRPWRSYATINLWNSL